MRVQFLGKKGKLLYCDDNIVRISKKKQVDEWKIDDIGGAWVNQHTIYFCNNNGALLGNVDYDPLADEKAVNAILNHIAKQGKETTINQETMKYVQGKSANKKLTNILTVILALVMIFTALATLGKLSPEESYVKSTEHYIKRIYEEREKVSELISYQNYGDYQWQKDIAKGLESLGNTIIYGAGKIEVPASAQNIHLNFSESMAYLLDATANLSESVKELDVDKMNSVSASLKKADMYMERYMKDLAVYKTKLK